jgi:riboflavin synthase
MFSGLIWYRGEIVAGDPAEGGALTLRVRCDGASVEHPVPKESIAIDGACLTATRITGETIDFDVVPETLRRTTLGERRPGDRVNIEYALRFGDRMGGHFVYGHVDAVGTVLERRPEGQGEIIRIERPRQLAFALVDKAFVAVDGVSLTIAAAASDWFEIALIPETLAATTLGERAPGSRVNLEIDPVARYAARP